MSAIDTTAQPPEYNFSHASLSKELKDLSGHHIRLVPQEGSNVQAIKIDSTFKKWCNQTFRGIEYASTEDMKQILQKIPKSPISLEQSNVGRLALWKLGKQSLEKTAGQEEFTKTQRELRSLLPEKMGQIYQAEQDKSELRSQVERLLLSGNLTFDFSKIDQQVVTEVKANLYRACADRLNHDPKGHVLLEHLRDTIRIDSKMSAQDIAKARAQKFDMLMQYGIDPKNFTINEEKFFTTLSLKIGGSSAQREGVRLQAVAQIRQFALEKMQFDLAQSTTFPSLPKLWDRTNYEAVFIPPPDVAGEAVTKEISWTAVTHQQHGNKFMQAVRDAAQEGAKGSKQTASVTSYVSPDNYGQLQVPKLASDVNIQFQETSAVFGAKGLPDEDTILVNSDPDHFGGVEGLAAQEENWSNIETSMSSIDLKNKINNKPIGNYIASVPKQATYNPFISLKIGDKFDKAIYSDRDFEAATRAYNKECQNEGREATTSGFVELLQQNGNLTINETPETSNAIVKWAPKAKEDSPVDAAQIAGLMENFHAAHAACLQGKSMQHDDPTAEIPLTLGWTGGGAFLNNLITVALCDFATAAQALAELNAERKRNGQEPLTNVRIVFHNIGATADKEERDAAFKTAQAFFNSDLLPMIQNGTSSQALQDKIAEYAAKNELKNRGQNLGAA